MRSIFFCFVTCLIGFAIGLMVNIFVIGDQFITYSHFHTPNLSETMSTNVDNHTIKDTGTDENQMVHDPMEDEEALIYESYAVLNALHEKDYNQLKTLAHPDKGVTFTPYSTVDLQSDRVFKADEIAEFESNLTLYIWGMNQESNEPIQMSIHDYIDRFVYNVNYLEAPCIGINHVISSGNALENVSTAYKGLEFVEFYFPGSDPEENGSDWSALKLIFEQYNNKYTLVGFIHSEWTV